MKCDCFSPEKYHFVLSVLQNTVDNEHGKEHGCCGNYRGCYEFALAVCKILDQAKSPLTVVNVRGQCCYHS